MARSCGKVVWVVDIFDPSFDTTLNSSGARMCELYNKASSGRSAEEIFWEVNRKNVAFLRVVKGDSRNVRFPGGVRFSFGFIDGNHDPAWVESDFYLIWRRLEPAGAIGFHDYGGDLPHVTAKIDELIHLHRCNICDVSVVPEKWLIFLTKSAYAA